MKEVGVILSYILLWGVIDLVGRSLHKGFVKIKDLINNVRNNSNSSAGSSGGASS